MFPDPSDSSAPGGHTSATAFSAIAVMMVALSTLLAAIGAVPPLTGFNGFLLGGVLGVPALGWAVRRDGFASKAAALALVPVAALGLLVVAAAGHPVIRDVSTAPADPPIANRPGLSEDLRRPHLARVQNVLRSAHPDLTGRVIEGRDLDASQDAVVELLHARGWEVQDLDAPAGERLLHAVAVSTVFHFRDDVLVRLRERTEGGVRIDVRSASRVGKSDLGANARRVRSLLSDLEEELGARRPSRR